MFAQLRKEFKIFAVRIPAVRSTGDGDR